MSNKKNLVESQLKALLFTRFKLHQNKQAQLEKRFKQEFVDLFQIDPLMQEVKKKIDDVCNRHLEQMSSMLAYRLMKKEGSVPLLSTRDCKRLIQSMIEEISDFFYQELNLERSSILDELVKIQFENVVLETAHVMILKPNDLYNEYWRWIKTVMDVSGKRKALAIGLPALENYNDEIVRRLFTKNQFVALSKRSYNKCLILNTSDKNGLGPLLKLTINKYPKSRKSELFKQLEHVNEIVKTTINSFVTEEANRIYLS